MLFTLSAVLLVVWLAVTVGPVSFGDAGHLLLLVGLMLGLLGVLKARDTAVGRGGRSE